MSIFSNAKLAEQLTGELHLEETMRRLYATDASSYRELPLAVCFPNGLADLQLLVKFALAHRIGLIPRTAGTSLAGQVVGNGIVVDLSRHFTAILELNVQEQWIRLQPGVVRDDLNRYLAPHGLYFGPETSTANRAMIGGMAGNNSCGSNSVVYGSTREHMLEMKVLLDDGVEVSFGPLSKAAFEQKTSASASTNASEASRDSHTSETESRVYADLKAMLSPAETREKIIAAFPKATIPRRNTGYALDILSQSNAFSEFAMRGGRPSSTVEDKAATEKTEDFNFCKLLCGSEGTLGITTELKLKLSPLPPPVKGLMCIHFKSIHESLVGNLTVLRFQPSASELMDHYVLSCTKEHPTFSKYQFFIEGEPQAILVAELSGNSRKELEQRFDAMETALCEEKLGYHYPRIYGDEVSKVWQLRKAGLGLLANLPGDGKAVPVIEDTAVDVVDLPAYIQAFNDILKKHDLYAVHYAHAGSGELHLRPIINLKTAEGHALFRTIATEVAELVKKFRASLSGEHGDGRLRGEFLPLMVGEEVYQLLRQVKYSWDPNGIFNPGKIVDTPSMNESLRYRAGQKTPEFDTIFDFSANGGFLRAAENCNGSADCRKSAEAGGTMCPSYMATLNERDTTRARANVLRETISWQNQAVESATELSVLGSAAVKDVMDLCLSCKGCKSECPSNVDMARLKAEAMHQHHKLHGLPLRTRLFGNANRLNTLAMKFGPLSKIFLQGPFSGFTKKLMGVASERALPAIQRESLRNWFRKNREQMHTIADKANTLQNDDRQKGDGLNKGNRSADHRNTDEKSVYLFADAFTDLLDTTLGIKTIQLLSQLGYKMEIPAHVESGRTYLSKGMLEEARKLAAENVERLHPLISQQKPLIGLEPSAILTFVDEYPDLLRGAAQRKAKELAEHVKLADDFIYEAFQSGAINRDSFTTDAQNILLHGHCHQKALGSIEGSAGILEIPQNYRVQAIPSGCCGMAGSFGYEKEHYAVSMKIGELVLFPAVRKAGDALIAAPGTSCRHQIQDGTGTKALHPIEILYNALR